MVRKCKKILSNERFCPGRPDHTENTAHFLLHIPFYQDICACYLTPLIENYPSYPVIYCQLELIQSVWYC